MNKKLPAINIQFPISRLILEKNKVVETRTYPLPQKYLNQEMFIIETPGAKGNFVSRVIGTITFSGCFMYESKEDFYLDFDRHKVTPQSSWAWGDKSKWGWEISHVTKFKVPQKYEGPKGIIFTKQLEL